MRRTTDRQASVPELTKRTISTDGTRSITILASTFCQCNSDSGGFSWRANQAHPSPPHASQLLCEVQC